MKVNVNNGVSGYLGNSAPAPSCGCGCAARVANSGGRRMTPEERNRYDAWLGPVTPEERGRFDALLGPAPDVAVANAAAWEVADGPATIDYGELAAPGLAAHVANSELPRDEFGRPRIDYAPAAGPTGRRLLPAGSWHDEAQLNGAVVYTHTIDYVSLACPKLVAALAGRR